MEAIEEELMALESIFYDSFTKIDHNRFRVRVDPSTDEAVESEPPSVPPLFIELLLPSSYPDQQIPLFDISNLNNASYSELAKKHIVQGLQEQVFSSIENFIMRVFINRKLAPYIDTYERFFLPHQSLHGVYVMHIMLVDLAFYAINSFLMIFMMYISGMCVGHLIPGVLT